MRIKCITPLYYIVEIILLMKYTLDIILKYLLIVLLLLYLRSNNILKPLLTTIK
jgi:hypothetical protein